MLQIINPKGVVVRRSSNLRGIVDHARRVPVQAVHVRELPRGAYHAAQLRVVFANGDTCDTGFQDWGICQRYGKGFAKRRGAEYTATAVQLP